MFTLETRLTYKRHPEFFVGLWGYAAPHHKEVKHDDGTIHKELAVAYGVSNSPLGLRYALWERKRRGKADPNVRPEKIVTWKQAEKYADNMPVNKRKVVTDRRFEDPEAVVETLNGYRDAAEPNTELATGRAQVWEDQPVRNGRIGFVAVGRSQGSYLYDQETKTWLRNEFMPMLARRSRGIIVPGYIRARHDYVDFAPAAVKFDLTTPADFQIDNPYGLHT